MEWPIHYCKQPFFRPKLKKKKVANLYFTGSAYRAWPWSTPALISGKLVSELIVKNVKLLNMKSIF